MLFLVTVMFFSACSLNTSLPASLREEGVAPYEMSESELYLFRSLGIEQDTNILSFKAPETAKSLKVNVYVLDDNQIWRIIGGGQVSLGEDASPIDRLEGTFAMMLKDNYQIEFNISIEGRASYRTDILDVDNEILASARSFLNDFQRIEIDKEIPVAIMVYDSGTSIRSYCMDDFFSPSKFHGMDLVQAVTLTFLDGYEH